MEGHAPTLAHCLVQHHQQPKEGTKPTAAAAAAPQQLIRHLQQSAQQPSSPQQVPTHQSKAICSIAVAHMKVKRVVGWLQAQRLPAAIKRWLNFQHAVFCSQELTSGTSTAAATLEIADQQHQQQIHCIE